MCASCLWGGGGGGGPFLKFLREDCSSFLFAGTVVFLRTHNSLTLLLSLQGDLVMVDAVMSAPKSPIPYPEKQARKAYQGPLHSPFLVRQRAKAVGG